MFVCVPRPVDSVAPQGRRLRIYRGGSGRWNGSTDCTVWYCVGVCAQKVKSSPTPCPAQLGSTPPYTLSALTYSIVVLRRKFFCKWPKASLSVSLALSFKHSSLPRWELKRKDEAILPSSCHVVTIRSKYNKTLCNLCDVSRKILGLRNWYPRIQIGINTGIFFEEIKRELAPNFYIPHLFNTCIVDHILKYAHIHINIHMYTLIHL